MTVRIPALQALGIIQLELADAALNTNGTGITNLFVLGEELVNEYESEPDALDSLLEDLPIDKWRDPSKEKTTVYLLVKLILHANEPDDPQLRYGCYYEIDLIGRIDFPYLLRQTERNLARFILPD